MLKAQTDPRREGEGLGAAASVAAAEVERGGISGICGRGGGTGRRRGIFRVVVLPDVRLPRERVAGNGRPAQRPGAGNRLALHVFAALNHGKPPVTAALFTKSHFR